MTTGGAAAPGDGKAGALPFDTSVAGLVFCYGLSGSVVAAGAALRERPDRS
jgi:hypothetical protein